MKNLPCSSKSIVHLLIESSNWANVIHPVDGIEDVVDVKVVVELGKSPKEAVAEVVVVVVAVVTDCAPNDSEVGAALLVDKEPKVIPMKVWKYCEPECYTVTFRNKENGNHLVNVR